LRYTECRKKFLNGRRDFGLRACFKIMEGAVFALKAGWQGATKENIPGGSSTEEQRSQAAFSAKTLRAAVLLAAACVGSALTARCGDAPASPPWPQPKSPAAAPSIILKQALRQGGDRRRYLEESDRLAAFHWEESDGAGIFSCHKE
jgi:hypothetical protein